MVSVAGVNAPGISQGVMYVDSGGYCRPPGSTRPDGAGGFGPGYDFNSAGTISIPGVGAVNSITHGSCPGGVVSTLRLEMYPIPYGGTWDPFTSPSGGLHLQAANGANLGTLTMPSASTGGIKPMGVLRSGSGPITGNGRIEIDLFQDQGFATGTRGAFGSFPASKGNAVTTGWIFPGSYNLFITDKVTGAQIRALASFNAASSFDLDLDATCMGFDICTYLAGSPPTPGGGFHPLSPTRILDTRIGLGISGGVGPGDGRNPTEPNNFKRAEWLENHQLKVTGVGGVPTTGVAAVLLNVTVTSPWTAGWLNIYPKLPRREIFDDQSLFRTSGDTSNLNFNANETLPNLVVARVGAGGHIMVENSSLATHVIADVAGWFGTGNDGGDGFTGVTPLRIMDTRAAEAPAFGPAETRVLQVTGRAGVPGNATAVALNVTQIESTGAGFITVWPTGSVLPVASNLNGAVGRTRPNMVVVKLGAGGKINLFNSEGTSHLAVDVIGYYAPSGAMTFPVNPTRIMDSRNGTRTTKAPLGAGETRALKVTDIAGVPSDATAVIVNVTGVQSTSGTFLTVFPTGVAQPVTSNINLGLGDPAPNLVMMRVGSGGSISIYNDRGSVHTIVDVVAYMR